MTYKIAILMDPISQINIKKDSSFAMLIEAQKRNHDLYYLEQKDLILDNGKVLANLSKITVQKDPEQWFQLTEPKATPLSEMDVVLMRKDPPFDMEFIYSTYLLEMAEREGVLIVNKPASLRDHNEKLFTGLVSRVLHSQSCESKRS